MRGTEIQGNPSANLRTIEAWEKSRQASAQTLAFEAGLQRLLPPAREPTKLLVATSFGLRSRSCL